MRRILSVLFAVLLLCACTETQTTVDKPDCPTVQEPQCPFGDPIQYCTRDDGCFAPIVVHRHQYSIGYSIHHNTPIWACETVSKSELVGTAQRKSYFSLDPLLGPRQAKSADYTGTGYDRAHMVAAQNHVWHQDYMDQTFYMSNVTPMTPSVNRGIWRAFETWVRDWVTKHGDAYVITGPLFISIPQEHLEGAEWVDVPSHFYKILVSKRGTTSWHAIAFIFDHNVPYKTPYDWRDYVVSIGLLEDAAHLNFMPNLSDSNQARMELKTANFDLWVN